VEDSQRQGIGLKLIDRHLLGTFIPPFLFGLSVTTFLLMIDVLQNYIDLFLEKGIRFEVATEILALSLGHTFALTIPMAVMIGILMSVGHLAGDQEITALKACGVGLYRLARPLFVAGTVIALAMIAYNHFLLPRSNHRLRARLFEVQQLRPTLEIRPNTFVDITQDYTIYVRHKNDRLGTLEDVILYEREGSGDPSPDVVVAETGQIVSVAPGLIRLELFNGEYHRLPDPEDPLTYSKTAFRRQSFDVNLELEGSGRQAVLKPGERDMNLHQLAAASSYQDSLATNSRAAARAVLERYLAVAYNEADLQTREAMPVGRNTLDEWRSHVNRADRTSRQLSLTSQTTTSYEVRSARYMVEWHKKFSIPVACMVFVVLGIPLAIASSRGGRGVAVGLSVAAFMIYYLFISLGEKLADRGLLDPWLSMWAADIVLGTIGAYLFHRTVKETRVVQLQLPGFLRRRTAE
jgi:lipopolysaccharide export system permease protein